MLADSTFAASRNDFAAILPPARGMSDAEIIERSLAEWRRRKEPRWVEGGSLPEIIDRCRKRGDSESLIAATTIAMLNEDARGFAKREGGAS